MAPHIITTMFHFIKVCTSGTWHMAHPFPGPECAFHYNLQTPGQLPYQESEALETLLQAIVTCCP